MRGPGFTSLLILLTLAGAGGVVNAQQPEPTTRQGAIEKEQAEKAKDLHPYVPTKAEGLAQRVENILTGQRRRPRPYFDSAYAGGGFALGLAYTQFVNAYNFVDMRGSYSTANYKRVEAEFVAPRLFHRRGELSVLGGWRNAPEINFTGLGNDTSVDNKTSFSLTLPYVSTLLTLKPTRRFLTLRGGIELSKWTQESGEGRYPSVETVYTPATLAGLGADPTYVHTQGMVGFDWRASPGYARRGGFLGVTGHDYSDRDKAYGFQQVVYEGIQHVPVLRETWVFSFRARAATTIDKGDQQIPFFMMPYLGGSSSLRGYTSLRFRDRNSLLLQAEWRIMASRFLDSAVFYDAGKVAARPSDLNFDGMHHDFGFGLRFHGPFFTPLRVELAKGNEGLVLVFASSAVF